MVGGRAAWNVVTSLNDSEAANFGRETHPDHDARYDRADEFMEAVLGHWDTWEDDAIILDRERGVFADPAKVHRLDHAGTFFRTRGPFTVPATPQGHPVIIQAGQSGRGPPVRGALGRADLRHLARTRAGPAGLPRVQGRDRPGRARSRAGARSRPRPMRGRGDAGHGRGQGRVHRPPGASPRRLVLLSEVLNFDFAALGMDEAFSDPDLAAISGLQALRDRVIRASGKPNPTVRDFIQHSGRGTLREMPRIRRQCGRGRRRARGVVHRRGLRRIRPRGDTYAGRLRGLRAARGAGAAAARVVSPRVRGATLRENLGLPRPVAARGESRSGRPVEHKGARARACRSNHRSSAGFAGATYVWGGSEGAVEAPFDDLARVPRDHGRRISRGLRGSPAIEVNEAVLWPDGALARKNCIPAMRAEQPAFRIRCVLHARLLGTRPPEGREGEPLTRM